MGDEQSGRVTLPMTDNEQSISCWIDDGDLEIISGGDGGGGTSSTTRVMMSGSILGGTKIQKVSWIFSNRIL